MPRKHIFNSLGFNWNAIGISQNKDKAKNFLKVAGNLFIPESLEFLRLLCIHANFGDIQTGLSFKNLHQALDMLMKSIITPNFEKQLEVEKIMVNFMILKRQLKFEIIKLNFVMQDALNLPVKLKI
jgi:hypothetical protein